jgi:hypothetical protein
MAILPITGVNSTIVKEALGAGSHKWSVLCKHANINKWSRWKPIKSNKDEGITESDLITAHCGLDRDPQTQVITYNPPRGKAYSEPFRIGDFRGYNTLATPPVTVEIIGVRSYPGGSVTYTQPYRLIRGDDYAILFKLSPGDIDPTWINPETSRVKNTDADGGYGGVTWSVNPSYLVDEERLPSEVFTCELLGQGTFEQRLNQINGSLRLQYCYYKGSVIDKYGTLPYYIEDDGFDNSYRSLFSIVDLDISINKSYTWTLQQTLGELYVRIGLFSAEANDINVKVKLEYKRIETGTTYYFDSGAFTLAAGYDSSRFFGPLTGWSNGYNSYEVKARLYRIRADLQEIEMDYVMQTVNITIQSGG